MTQMSFSEIKDRPFLTVEEASVYSHIGAESIRRLIAEPNSDFAVRV